jgi:hypothetical protein
MARGADLPPITWNAHPNRAGKSALDQMPDHNKLFVREEFRDPAMAAAIQALLYLWNGWPQSAAMYAQLATPRERDYIEALAARQAGDTARTKDFFSKVDGHPIYAALAGYATETIGLSTTHLLKRLRDTIAFGEQWEPFAFGDVYEQARTGQLDPTGEQIVRSLQCREFEMLFAFCYEGATGVKLGDKKADSAARRPPPKRPTPPKRPPQHRPDDQKPPESEPTGEKKARKPVEPLVCLGVEVLCPKCQEINSFREDSRGSTGRCRKCGAMFLIPKKAATSDAAQP